MDEYLLRRQVEFRLRRQFLYQRQVEIVERGFREGSHLRRSLPSRAFDRLNILCRKRYALRADPQQVTPIAELVDLGAPVGFKDPHALIAQGDFPGLETEPRYDVIVQLGARLPKVAA